MTDNYESLGLCKCSKSCCDDGQTTINPLMNENGSEILWP